MARNERFEFDPDTHGSGGFAKVFRGRDTYLERDVAVKVLDRLFTRFGQEDHERFRREARILAKLSHPNIPAIYDVRFDAEQPIIIFEFIEGVNLADYIRDEGPCSLPRARQWFCQVAAALDHAHERGVIHRDVKPSNIILSPGLETAYLVDFGIALSAEDQKRITESGYAVGTVGYMSPEQSRGEDVDRLTDIYSLGVTLYEALAGDPIAVGQYQLLSAANEGIPPEIDALIQDCIRHDRDARVSSAVVFAQRLAGALRTQRPLSEILAHGRLHEIGLALEDYSAESLAALPAGQKDLILSRLVDIVESEDESLRFAGASMLELMLPRGLLLQKDQYRKIVKPALVWAFEKSYPGYEGQGKRSLQEQIASVCLKASGDSYDVLHEEIGDFMQGVAFDEKPDWYLHNSREVLTCLLANPACTTGSGGLAELRGEVNRIQRSRDSHGE
jgi:serine/threonine protein kinase